MTRKILIGMLSLLLFLSLTACESKKVTLCLREEIPENPRRRPAKAVKSPM